MKKLYCKACIHVFLRSGRGAVRTAYPFSLSGRPPHGERPPKRFIIIVQPVACAGRRCAVVAMLTQ